MHDVTLIFFPFLSNPNEPFPNKKDDLSRKTSSSCAANNSLITKESQVGSKTSPMLNLKPVEPITK